MGIGGTWGEVSWAGRTSLRRRIRIGGGLLFFRLNWRLAASSRLGSRTVTPRHLSLGRAGHSFVFHSGGWRWAGRTAAGDASAEPVRSPSADAGEIGRAHV